MSTETRNKTPDPAATQAVVHFVGLVHALSKGDTRALAEEHAALEARGVKVRFTRGFRLAAEQRRVAT